MRYMRNFGHAWRVWKEYVVRSAYSQNVMSQKQIYNLKMIVLKLGNLGLFKGFSKWRKFVEKARTNAVRVEVGKWKIVLGGEKFGKVSEPASGAAERLGRGGLKKTRMQASEKRALLF